VKVHTENGTDAREHPALHKTVDIDGIRYVATSQVRRLPDVEAALWQYLMLTNRISSLISVLYMCFIHVLS
jgi:hypothetical protein